MLTIVLLIISGCTHHAGSNRTALSAGEAADASAKRYGNGRYPHRLTLINPQTQKPWPNHPFRLFTKYHDLPIWQPSEKIFHGVTDADGMTPVFRMKFRISDAGWVIMERVGDGTMGKSFRVMSKGLASKPIANYPYTVVMCTAQPIIHSGYTDYDGNTAYLAANVAATIHLLTEVADEAKEDVADVCKQDGK